MFLYCVTLISTIIVEGEIMAFIRDRESELTGFQEHAPFNKNIDVQTDFIMVYGTDDTMPKRIAEFREQGYVVHLMTGIAWGEYQDYLFGEWDGQEHWDEAQMDRYGNHILHGKDVPYMVPTISFADYLTDKLKVAVDSGVVAIHLEEPEFWDYGGYSEAFKREYKLFYRQDWKPLHEDLETRYCASKLKAYLYARTLDRICGALKEYALVKYDRVVRFYVPTHSLVNYTQWKIMSPEGNLIDLPTIDGFIAQIWTGTSRSENVYAGVAKERTFETSYLEYGIMQELVKGTGRKMWFLHDPIEDNPQYPWEDFKYNYLKTVTASLLHPLVHTYEICPWPNRVFNGVYPRDQKTQKPLSNAKSIPQDYNTLLCNMINTLGNMDKSEFSFDGLSSGVGVLMSDTGLYQRTYPDTVLTPTGRKLGDKPHPPQSEFAKMQDDETSMKEFITSGYFPNFYGLTLPLLKYGLPVRPVQLDNLKRYSGYLDDYQTLILSYEFCKPTSPDINNGLASWVKEGGTLIYVGDGTDPYHNIPSWWNNGKDKYVNPSQHLFAMLGLDKTLADGMYQVGKGIIAVKNSCPAKICATPENADQFRTLVREILTKTGHTWDYTNSITLRRGEYIISDVMDESITDKPNIFTGLFADMFTPDFKIITEKVVNPDENTLLLDFDKCKEKSFIVGTSARIFSLEQDDKNAVLEVRSPNSVMTNIRIRFNSKVKTVTATDKNNHAVAIDITNEYCSLSDTNLLSYESSGDTIVIRCEF